MIHPSGQTLIILVALMPTAGAMIGRLAPSLVRWLSPASATILLTSLALTIALATGLLLCLLAVVGLAEFDGLRGLGHWSPAAMRTRVPIPQLPMLIGGSVAALLIVSASRHLVRVIGAIRRSAALAAALPRTGHLVLAEDPAVYAYALPGRHGCIVTSTGMLSCLTGAQRRVLLAHETSHLRRHHHVYVQLGRLAAAANPFTRPISRAIDLSVERWADEDAAREFGDREETARALAVASLASSAAARPTVALGAAQAHIVERVGALLGQPVRRRTWLVVVTGAVVAVLWVATALLLAHIHGLMELAEVSASY